MGELDQALGVKRVVQTLIEVSSLLVEAESPAMVWQAILAVVEPSLVLVGIAVLDLLARYDSLGFFVYHLSEAGKALDTLPHVHQHLSLVVWLHVLFHVQGNELNSQGAILHEVVLLCSVVQALHLIALVFIFDLGLQVDFLLLSQQVDEGYSRVVALMAAKIQGLYEQMLVRREIEMLSLELDVGLASLYFVLAVDEAVTVLVPDFAAEPEFTFNTVKLFSKLHVVFAKLGFLSSLWQKYLALGFFGTFIKREGLCKINFCFWSIRAKQRLMEETFAEFDCILFAFHTSVQTL